VRKTIASLGSAALILLALPSQLMAETLPIEGVYPAGNDKLATLSTLAISAFGGADGEALSIDLEQKLRDITIRGNSYFNILASRGRGGVDGIISGTANGRSESRHELGQRQECVYRNAKGNCKETRWVKINCTRRIVTLNYTLGVEGSRRERIFAITKTAVNSELICPDSGEVAPVDVVVGQLVSGVANELRMQFAPAEVRENIRVKEGVEGLQGNAKSKFKDAIKLTKRNVASACNVWAEVDQLVPNHSPTLFNLGLCAESRRDYNGAEALYKRVADLNRSETYAVEAIARINRHRHAERQIAAQAAKTRK
jgi:tetratricopeptide (TPR) repeat protein